jgi:hypothetical protein
MRLRQAAGLWTAALLSATGALADVKGVRIPPSFSPQEIELIGKDARLVGAARQCAWQLRQALDALADAGQGSRVGTAPEPCQLGSGGPGRASDEGALDILKILRDISEQGAGRSGGGDAPLGAPKQSPPSFTSEEVELIHKDKTGALRYAARRCAWQLRHALDALRHGAKEGPPQRPCLRPDGTRGSDEGALDILKILREASGDSKN